MDRDSTEALNFQISKKLKRALEQEAKKSRQSMTAIFHRAVEAELRRRARGGDPHRESDLTDQERANLQEQLHDFFESDAGRELLEDVLSDGEGVAHVHEDRRAGDTGDEGMQQRDPNKSTEGRVRAGEFETLADRLGLGKLPLPWSKRKERS